MTASRALVFALAFLAGAGECHAHASLLSSTPGDAAALPSAPARITLRFDEPVVPLAMKLVDDAGGEVPLSAVSGRGSAEFSAALPARLRDGAYLFSYRVASADSHPVGGSLWFSVGKAASPPPASAAGAGLSGAGGVAVRALRTACLLIAVGGALFALLLGRFPGEQLVLTASAVTAAVLGIAFMQMQGTALAGVPFLSTDAWQAAMQVSAGPAAMVSMAGMAAITVAAWLARGWLRGGFLAAGALAGCLGLSLTGHAASSFPGLAGPMLAAHALAAAFWIGSLVALYRLCGSAGAAAAVRRFSRAAMVAIAVLFAAGATFAALQLGTFAKLATTSYGCLILAKAALLAGLLALAARNRYWLLPRMERGEAGAGARMRASIAVELALLAAVVAVTAVLAQTPPRTARIDMTLQEGGRRAELTITPGRPGRNAVEIVLSDEGGARLEPAEIQLEISNPAAAIEPMARSLVPVSPGVYRLEGGELAFAGSWRLVLRARFGEFDQVVFSGVADVR